MKDFPAQSRITPKIQPPLPAARRVEGEAKLLPLLASRREEGANATTLARTDLRYWEQRLVQSAYGSLARPRAVREFSTRIEHEGVSFFFPLGSEKRKPAASRALKIYQTVLTEGWPNALERYAHELTLAVLWTEDPMIFTYTTLYSAANQGRLNGFKRLPPSQPQGKISLALIEPDANYGQALAQWVDSLSEYAFGGLFTNGAEAVRALEGHPADLVLFNRQLPDLAAGELARTFKHFNPALPAFGYRIYPNSDELFISQPGKSGGYYFRRRPPQDLLEPIREAGPRSSSAEWHTCVCSYVAKLFRFPLGQDDPLGPGTLTGREHDILSYLCQGSSDKGIAQALNISAWTVHTHLKKIYAKLGAHSRTEAVVKYLQK